MQFAPPPFSQQKRDFRRSNSRLTASQPPPDLHDSPSLHSESTERAFFEKAASVKTLIWELTGHFVSLQSTVLSTCRVSFILWELIT